MESGNGIPTWWRKRCAILGKMGIAGIRNAGTMEMVVVGGDVPEMKGD